MLQQYQCIICNREITNPICAACNFRHLHTWLNETPIELRERAMIIRQIKRYLFVEKDNELNCIICHAQEVCICTFCFFTQTKSIIASVGLGEDVMEEFELCFNHEIYSDYTIAVTKEKTWYQSQ